MKILHFTGRQYDVSMTKSAFGSYGSNAIRSSVVLNCNFYTFVSNLLWKISFYNTYIRCVTFHAYRAGLVEDATAECTPLKAHTTQLFPKGKYHCNVNLSSQNNVEGSEEFNLCWSAHSTPHIWGLISDVYPPRKKSWLISLKIGPVVILLDDTSQTKNKFILTNIY